jgi:hypothetical protein
MTTSITTTTQQEFPSWSSILTSAGPQTNMLAVPPFFKAALKFYNLDVLFIMYEFSLNQHIQIKVLALKNNYKFFTDQIQTINAHFANDPKPMIATLNAKNSYTITALLIDKSTHLKKFVATTRTKLKTPVLGFAQVDCIRQNDATKSTAEMVVYLSGLASIHANEEYLKYITENNIPRIDIS